MAKQSKKAKTEADPELDEALESATETEEGTTATEAAAPPTPEERVAELENLLARAQADYANLRRRALADQDAAVARAEASLLCELLTFADWLDMALVTEVQSPDAITIKEGVRLTRDQLAGMLTSQGVQVISTEGKFDPDLHQAVATVEAGESEEGTIAAVVRKGWTRRGAVLRHAQVKVHAAPEQEQEQDEAPSGEEGA